MDMNIFCLQMKRFSQSRKNVTDHSSATPKKKPKVPSFHYDIVSGGDKSVTDLKKILIKKKFKVEVERLICCKETLLKFVSVKLN